MTGFPRPVARERLLRLFLLFLLQNTCPLYCLHGNRGIGSMDVCSAYFDLNPNISVVAQS